MPKYTFTCHHCGESKQQIITDLSIKEFPCGKCDSAMIRDLPKLSGKTGVTEVVDSHTGVTWGDDHVKAIDDRKRIYYWEVEVPRMVNSGTYSLETMLENRWVYYDDRGNLITRTRPPESE